MTPLPEGMGDTIVATIGTVVILLAMAAYYGPAFISALRTTSRER